MTENQNQVDQVLGLLEKLSTEELEQISKTLKKMLFRCRVQEKINARREDVAQRLSEVLSHRMEKTAED